MLSDILETKKCFKLVCGAGNEDIAEVEKLVAIYSKAGCQFFDVCAKQEVLEAAKRGLKRAGITKDRYLCVSVGLAGDPHITKATIDYKKCKNCQKCVSLCIHDAIITENKTKINSERCLGCGLCAKNCPHNAINMISKVQNYEEILPPLIEKGIDCIEFHIISEDEKDVDAKWELLNHLYDGMLCISVDRSELGDKKLKARIERMLKQRAPYTTIIQADGVAMSGSNDEYGTTLQAVATAQLFQNANMPAYIMMSGGTNTKSIELAKLCTVEPHCLAVGSYARKIVKEYLQRDDIWENQIVFNQAVDIAKTLVNTTLEQKN